MVDLKILLGVGAAVLLSTLGSNCWLGFGVQTSLITLVIDLGREGTRRNREEGKKIVSFEFSRSHSKPFDEKK